MPRQTPGWTLSPLPTQPRGGLRVRALPFFRNRRSTLPSLPNLARMRFLVALPFVEYNTDPGLRMAVITTRGPVPATRTL